MPGFRAAFARFVDDQFTIIILMNLDDVDVETIVRGIAALYLPRPAPTRAIPPTGTRSDRTTWSR
jgi:hypothetical protein